MKRAEAAHAHPIDQRRPLNQRAVETLKLRVMLRGAKLAHSAKLAASAAASNAGAAARGGVRLPPPPAARAALAGGGGRELLQGLHVGLGGTLMASLPTGLVYWWTYELCASHLRISLAGPNAGPRLRGAPPHVAVHLASAAAAAAASSVVRVPTDVVRQRVQAGLDANIVSAAKAAWRRGPKGLYGGWAATLLRDIPELLISFTLFEIGRQHWLKAGGGGGEEGDGEEGEEGAPAAAGGRSARERGGGAREGGAGSPRQRVRGGGSGRQVEPWRHMLLGGACGALSAGLTTPLDAIKARVQCGLGASAGGFAAVRQAAAAIIQESGPLGFTAGMGPRIVQVRGGARAAASARCCAPAPWPGWVAATQPAR